MFWHHTFCVFMSWNLRKSCQKRPNYLSQRSNQKFDTKLFVSWCLQIENPVKKRPNFLSQWEQSKDLTQNFLCLNVFKLEILSKKGRISYYNESNQKFWNQSSSSVLMKIHCEQKDSGKTSILSLIFNLMPWKVFKSGLEKLLKNSFSDKIFFWRVGLQAVNT